LNQRGLSSAVKSECVPTKKYVSMSGSSALLQIFSFRVFANSPVSLAPSAFIVAPRRPQDCSSIGNTPVMPAGPCQIGNLCQELETESAPRRTQCDNQAIKCAHAFVSTLCTYSGQSVDGVTIKSIKCSKSVKWCDPGVRNCCGEWHSPQVTTLPSHCLHSAYFSITPRSH
jgi:hypothetical protein